MWVAYEHNRPLPRHERPEPLERPGVDLHARRGEHDVVRVIAVRICDLVVQLAPTLVQRVKLGLITRQRPIATGAALPGRVGIDLEQHGECTVAQLVPDRRGLDRAAAQRDHGRVRQTQRCNRVTFLLQAELRLAAPLEELGDRRPEVLFEVAVEVDEGTPEPLRDLRAEGRLARAHEADEREVPVQRVRGCQSIRSRYA